MDKLKELNIINQPIENLYEINDAIQIKNICHEDTNFTLQFQIQSAIARNDKKFIDDNIFWWLGNFNFEKPKVNKMMAEIFKKISDVTQTEFNFEYGKFNKTEEIHFIKLILKAALLVKIDEFIKISKIVKAIYERSFDDESIPEIINSYTMKALNLFNFEELNSRGLDSLKYLNESFGLICKITSLEELRFLNFGTNKFFNIPCDITNLKKLKFLQIDALSIKEIPDCIGELKSLEHLIFGTFNFGDESPVLEIPLNLLFTQFNTFKFY